MKPARRIGKKSGTSRFSAFSKTVVTIPNMLLQKPGSEKAVQAAVHTEDEPLPGTLTFVLVMGAAFAVLWFLMFALLHERW